MYISALRDSQMDSSMWYFLKVPHCMDLHYCQQITLQLVQKLLYSLKYISETTDKSYQRLEKDVWRFDIVEANAGSTCQ